MIVGFMIYGFSFLDFIANYFLDLVVADFQNMMFPRGKRFSNSFQIGFWFLSYPLVFKIKFPGRKHCQMINVY